MLVLWLGLGTKTSWVWLGKHHGLALKTCFGRRDHGNKSVLVARKTSGTVSRSPEKTPCLISYKQLEISPEVLRNVHYCDTNCSRPFASLVITLLL